MSNHIVCSEIKLACIWTETASAVIRGSDPPEPLAFLNKDSEFEARFVALGPGFDPSGFSVPWPHASGQLFWTRYLGHKAKSLDTLAGRTAWKSLVPIRGRTSIAKITASWLPGRVFLDALFYPFGMALIATATLKASLSLKKAVELSHALRRTGKLDVQFADGTQRAMLLQEVADQCIGEMRARLGGGATPAAPIVPPFTIWAVVRGTGVDPAVDPPDGGDIHRALNAVTTWSATYEHDVLPALAEVRLEMRADVPASHVLYARKRGRAIWFPALFTRAEDGPPTIACFWRNLVWASVQTESLGGFLATVSDELDELHNDAALPFAEQECARFAAGVLGRMYGGDKSTYRSFSPRVQIDQNDMTTQINAVREHLKMALLH